MATKVLFLGGAGMIGSAVAAEAVAQGLDLTVITRAAPRRALPRGVRHIAADVHDLAGLTAAVGNEYYDSVVNWIGFDPSDLDGHVPLFSDRAGQYVFIGTCSVFGRPLHLPITEASPRRQPVFGYARNKIACELLLEAAYRDETNLPLTIVRPFHTYDRTVVPLLAGWTAIQRLRAGKGVVVHGDGTSLWSLMHSSDVGRALVPLLGNAHAIGESINLVSGDILTWDQIHLILAEAAGVREPILVHRASETIATEWPAWGEVLEHDFRHSMLFDTSKLRRLVPGFSPSISFSAGAHEVIAYHDANPGLQKVDAAMGAAFDRLIARP